MNPTSIQPETKPAVNLPSATTPPDSSSTATKSAAYKPGPIFRLLKLIGSMKLAVVLLALCLLLVFFGTLAQVHEGMWTVIRGYFRSFFVWIPFQIFFSTKVKIAGGFPYPGGWLLGSVLIVNLLCAHLTMMLTMLRSRGPAEKVIMLLTKRVGVFLIHGGLLLLMAGEVIAGLYQVEGIMSILQGESSNYVEHQEFSELAFIRRAQGAETTDQLIVVPATLLQKHFASNKVISHPDLPDDLQVEKYYANAELHERKEDKPVANLATHGHGLQQKIIDKPVSKGAESSQRVDTPACYVTFLEKGTERKLGTYLFSTMLSTFTKFTYQEMQLGDDSYDVLLRYKRTYRNFTLHLQQFTHDVYEGTDKPRDFRSEVQLLEPGKDEKRDVSIYMNHPMYYRGETFYQSGVLPSDQGTRLQVVRNPGWTLPYLACIVVCLGMLYHFTWSLVNFSSRRAIR